MICSPLNLFRPAGRSALMVPALAAVLGVFVGCSADRHTFNSTPTAPKSVSVTYVQTGETAWAYDIPVGKQLTLEFDREGQINGFTAPKTPATSLSWYVTTIAQDADAAGHPSRYKSEEAGEVALTGQPSQINVSIRELGIDEIEGPLDATPVPPPPPVDVEPAMDAVEVEPAADAMEDAADAADDAMDATEGAMDDAADQAEDAVEEATESMDK